MADTTDDLIVLSGNILSSCTLGDEEKANRIAFMKNKIFSSYLSKEELENGYIFVYDNNQDLAHSLLDFVIKEGSCCSFIDFDLGFRAKQKKIEFKVTTSTNNKEELKKGIQQIYSF